MGRRQTWPWVAGAGLVVVGAFAFLGSGSGQRATARLTAWASRWFSTAEMVVTSRNIANNPSAADWQRLALLVANVLDPIRAALGPTSVGSAFRSLELNTAIDGSPTSQHMYGEAADIKVRGYDAPALVRAILALGVPFDQVIGYAPEHGGHVHVSYTTRRANRRQVLWVPPGTPKRYVAFYV